MMENFKLSGKLYQDKLSLNSVTSNFCKLTFRKIFSILGENKRVAYFPILQYFYILQNKLFIVIRKVNAIDLKEINEMLW